MGTCLPGAYGNVFVRFVEIGKGIFGSDSVDYRHQRMPYFGRSVLDARRWEGPNVSIRLKTGSLIGTFIVEKTG